MNVNAKTPDSDDLLFDRLVDGELDERQRRELLTGLDNEPGGWRRCALAFLEAQCWRQTLNVVGTLRVPSACSPADGASAAFGDGTRSVPNTLTATSPWLGRARTLLAMAASFLIALALVSWTQHARFRQAPSTDVAGTVRVPSAGGNQVALGRAGEPSDRASGPWRLVTVSEGQNPGASFSLPAVERDRIDEQWLKNLPPAIPDNVLQALARTGHQVRQQRELIPVPLQDGRRLLMPVDRVEVHYVGNTTY